LSVRSALLDTMAHNVALNALGGAVTCAELNWCARPRPAPAQAMTRALRRGAALPPGVHRADVVLAADCVYFEPAFPLLVATLCALAGAETEVLLCYKKRRKVRAARRRCRLARLTGGACRQIRTDVRIFVNPGLILREHAVG
jgi:hypothetical protein